MEPNLIDPADPAAAAFHVAVVYAADGIRFLTAARTHAELTERLADYVQRNCERMLYEADAGRLRHLLAAGRTRSAVEWYFGRVGERWEREFLRSEVIPDGHIPSAGLVCGGAAPAVSCAPRSEPPSRPTEATIEPTPRS